MVRGLGCWLVGLSIQLHAMPAAAADGCWQSADPQRPHVRTVDGTVRVDNRCNDQAALVVVWRMYEPSSETFWTQPGELTVEPTLHQGRIRVWVIYSYDPDVDFTYRKRMRYSS